jgi:hypothetical protein
MASATSDLGKARRLRAVGVVLDPTGEEKSLGKPNQHPNPTVNIYEIPTSKRSLQRLPSVLADTGASSPPGPFSSFGPLSTYRLKHDC